MSVLRVSFNVSDLLFFEKRRVAIATRFVCGAFSRIRPEPQCNMREAKLRVRLTLFENRKSHLDLWCTFRDSNPGPTD